MATEAEMIDKIASIPLDPSDVTLTETLQDDGVYWVLSGYYYEPTPTGILRRMFPVEIIELKT